MFDGKKHYGDFRSSTEGISSNILENRLVKLESSGLISKSVDVRKRSRIIYGLTPKRQRSSLDTSRD